MQGTPILLPNFGCLIESPQQSTLSISLFIYSRKACFRGKTPSRLGHISSSGLSGRRKTYLIILKRALSADSKMVR
jgi:hypothetical protein